MSAVRKVNGGKSHSLKVEETNMLSHFISWHLCCIHISVFKCVLRGFLEDEVER